MKRLFVTLGAFALLSSALLANDIIIKHSNNSVDKTISIIENIVTKKGLNIFAIIDHAQGAKSVNMKLLPSKVIIFGNPKMGTLLMQDDASTALDLPMKIAVYEIQDGGVFMAYRSGSTLKKDHNMIKKERVINKINSALAKITTKAGM